MLWFFLYGVVTGMRTMTAIAVFCCIAACGGFPHLDQTWAGWTTKWFVAVLFVCAAIGEYIYDVSPKARSRKEPSSALIRLLVGGLVGALAATAIMEPIAGGVILAAMGVVAGTWGGYEVRMRLAAWLEDDRPAGALESAVALLLALYSMHLLHVDAVHSAIMENGALARWTNILAG